MIHVPPFAGHAGLAAWRAEHPNETWEAYKDSPTYPALRHALAEHAGWRCVYCEIRLSGRDPNDLGVEHYIPKKTTEPPGHNWHLDDQNLMACCFGGTRHHLKPPRASDEPSYAANHSCDKRKGDQSPVGEMVDPRRLPQQPMYTVRSDGEMAPRSTSILESDAARAADGQDVDGHAVDAALLESTISFLNLNCQRLREARAKIFEDTSNLLLDALELDAPELSEGLPEDVWALIEAAALAPDGYGRPADFPTTRLAALRDFPATMRALTAPLPK